MRNCLVSTLDFSSRHATNLGYTLSGEKSGCSKLSSSARIIPVSCFGESFPEGSILLSFCGWKMSYTKENF